MKKAGKGGGIGVRDAQCASLSSAVKATLKEEGSGAKGSERDEPLHGREQLVLFTCTHLLSSCQVIYPLCVPGCGVATGHRLQPHGPLSLSHSHWLSLLFIYSFLTFLPIT